MKKSHRAEGIDEILDFLATMEKYDDVINKHESERKKLQKKLDVDSSNHTVKQEMKKLDEYIDYTKQLRFEVFVKLIIYVRNLKNIVANKRIGYNLKALKAEMNIYLEDCKITSKKTHAAYKKHLKTTKIKISI
jgi:hypothetical protein